MANPTTSFGWVMPTSSSLVTNLPADFNTFGQAVDTSMQYLLGGTTGQVLSKTSGTNMAFTWVTPTDQTPLTTKGDLFTFTTVDARLAVGNNGETLVADSSTSTGLRYQATQAAGKNTIINGGMDNWQRGTSFAFIAGELYTADRWYVYRGTNALGATLSRQSSGVNFTQYCSRMQRDLSNTSVQPLYANYTMETQDSIGYAGQTITFSFYARAGANYSGGAFLGRALYGTGTNQKVTAFTGAAVITSVSATLTTSFQRFQGTATVNAAATEIGFDFGYTPTGTAGANDYVEFTGVQFEVGSVATAFTRAGGTLQGELAACQRYYFRNLSGNAYGNVANAGYTTGTTGVNIFVQFPVTMRTIPTSIDSGNLGFLDSLGGAAAVSAPSSAASGTSFANIAWTTSGAVVGRFAWLRDVAGAGTGFLGLSAEL